jgi:hypothetical protein
MIVLSGVPQGSVLAALLFMIFINDLPELMENIIKMYADDTKIIAKVGKESESETIQQDLNSCMEWSKKWLLAFNVEKCVVMHYGSNNPKAEYKMGDLVLKETKQERDLGVHFSNDLKWKSHIEKCKAKANALIGMIRKTFLYIDAKMLRILYLTFIRPVIEFAVPVWSPSLKGDIDEIERIQHRVTRLIPAFKKIPYEERLEKLRITTLETRRKRGDLIQLFKIFNNYEKVNLINKPKFVPSGRTQENNMRYLRETTKSDTRHNFLTNRSANLWNNLSNKATHSENINNFKAEIDQAMNDLEHKEKRNKLS